jgi:hypothetical protein
MTRLPVEKTGMSSSTLMAVNADTIWLAWESSMDAPTSQHARILRPVDKRSEARRDEKAEIERLLLDARAWLDDELPGYLWTIESDGGGPTLRYIIRGDRAGKRKTPGSVI